MKKNLPYFFTILLAIIITLILNNFMCDRDTKLKNAKEQAEKKIDSLNTIITLREDSIRVIQGRISAYLAEVVSLQEKINKKDSQIKYYKGQGRFDYVHTPDSLHRELNLIIKQRLSGDSGATDRAPR